MSAFSLLVINQVVSHLTSGGTTITCLRRLYIYVSMSASGKTSNRFIFKELLKNARLSGPSESFSNLSKLSSVCSALPGLLPIQPKTITCLWPTSPSVYVSKWVVMGAGFEPALRAYGLNTSARLIATSTLTTHQLSFKGDFTRLSRIEVPRLRLRAKATLRHNRYMTLLAHGVSALSCNSFPLS